MRSSVHIIQPDDVVFFKIAAGLDFDELQRNHSGILETMDGPERNIGGLVFHEDHLFGISRYFGRALDDDPVFRPVVVLLKGEFGPWIDGDALHLKARNL